MGNRFEVSLPTRIRYGALVGLITAVDWSVEFLVKNTTIDVPKTPNRTNQGLHVLRFFNRITSLGLDRILENCQNLVRLRDAIVHGAGIVRGREEAQINTAVSALNGFQIEDIVWLGKSITITRGALEPYIKDMADLIPQIYEAVDKAGLLSD